MFCKKNCNYFEKTIQKGRIKSGLKVNFMQEKMVAKSTRDLATIL